MMTEPLKSASPKLRRRRAAKSCEPCRLRKVKCDRHLPCKPCERSRAALQCTYRSTHPSTSAGSSEHALGSQSEYLQGDAESPEKLGALYGDGTTKSNDHPSTSPTRNRTTAGHSHDTSVLEYPTPNKDNSEAPNTSSLEEIAARLSRVEQSISDSLSEPRVSENSDIRIKLPRPHLRTEREKTRLFGKTHWTHSLDQFKILSQLQTRPYYSVVEEQQTDVGSEVLEASRVRRRTKEHGPKLLQEPMPTLNESIPCKPVCDQAVDAYLRTFEPIFRILHVPSFYKEYENYWTRTEPVQTEFLMKLTMILTIGSTFFPERSMSNEIKSTARSWVYAVQWWLTGPTERDAMSLGGIQVFCLLLLARQTHSLGGTASIMTEALLKLSFTLGLHVDPRNLASVTPFESELRRRLWLTVMELASITSLNSTYPLLVSAEDYQVPLPSNILDSKIGNGNDSDISEVHMKHSGLDCSLQLMLAKSLRLRMEIIRELNGMSGEASYERIITLAKSLQTQCREMAEFFEHNNTWEQGTGTTGFHQKFLDTYFRRLILFLHRPFAHQARKDHRFFLSRKVCLESCLVMASHMENVDLPSVNLDDFCYSCISGGGMFKGALGQEAILGISLEIITQLEEEGMGDSRNPRPRSRDPLAVLGQARRMPLMQFLRHTREQWKQVIILGRPSFKQYMFVSCTLSYIEAIESGQDPKASMLDTIRRELRLCTTLLQESPAYSNSLDVMSEWTDDTMPYVNETMALFGFDFNMIDPRFMMSMPV